MLVDHDIEYIEKRAKSIQKKKLDKISKHMGSMQMSHFAQGQSAQAPKMPTMPIQPVHTTTGKELEEIKGRLDKIESLLDELLIATVETTMP